MRRVSAVILAVLLLLTGCAGKKDSHTFQRISQEEARQRMDKQDVVILDVREQYEDAIKELLVGDHPEKVDVKRIKGRRNDYYRIKLGGYRVVYAIINGKIIVISTILAGVPGYTLLRNSLGMKRSSADEQ